MDNEEIQKELLVSFNQQFAENHNHHQQSFIQVLSVLLTVIIGYGYVFTNGGKMDVSNLKVNDFLLEASFLIASLIINFGLLLIINNAHAFRRDQFVVFKIRKKASLINDKNAIFPPNFDPSKSLNDKTELWKQFKKNGGWKRITIPYRWAHFLVSWMPNFYNILFLVLGILKFLLLLSFLLNPFDHCELSFDFAKCIHWGHLITFIFWALGTSYIFNRLGCFRKSLENLYKI